MRTNEQRVNLDGTVHMRTSEQRVQLDGTVHMCTNEQHVNLEGTVHMYTNEQRVKLDGTVHMCTNEQRVKLDLVFDHEEEDTKMFVLCKYFVDQYFIQRMRNSSPDTNILLVSCYHYFTTFQTSLNELWFKIGTGNKRRYVSIHETTTSLGSTICRILPALHSIIGCDSVSSFAAIGKTKNLVLNTNVDQLVDMFGFFDPPEL